ncbi:DNA polymerase III subunit gamma/tau, partial [Aromatoleum toluclasticum]|nr:DNA polymerase III subunit gamma/tau [Aromatoleum toluclasticum]
LLKLANQIAIHGRDEQSLAPDDYAGFTIKQQRQHAFRPDQPPALGSPAAEGGGGGVARSLPPAAPRPAAVPRPAPANAGAQSAPATPARSAAPSAS